MAAGHGTEAEQVRKVCRMKHASVRLLGLCAIGLLVGCNGRQERPDRAQSAPSPEREAPNPIDTPEKLLRKVLALASNKQYGELADHLAPLHLKRPPRGAAPAARDEPRDIGPEILEGIRTRKKTGDFAYSNKALLAILTNHLDRIGPVPEEMLEHWASGKGLGQDRAVQAAAKSGGRDLRCFARSGAFILMKNVGGQYRLAYWKNLNRVLGAAATAAAEASRYHDLEPITVKLRSGGKFVRAAVSLVTRADRADDFQKLLRTKKENVREWMGSFLAEQDPGDLAEKAKHEALKREIRDRLNRLLTPKGEPQIDAVVFRELTVQ